MKIAIANFSAPRPSEVLDYREFWRSYAMPAKPPRVTLLEQRHDWGFHITALGVFLLDMGLAHDAEFWSEGETRGASYDAAGVLRVRFANLDDVDAYVDRFGPPDLFINYGREGRPLLARLARRSFRVHVPCLRAGLERLDNHGADCYLVDDSSYLDRRSMLYVPVVNTRVLQPNGAAPVRDFVYLASDYQGKRHDLLLDAVRGTPLTGHLHPVDGARLDLSNTEVTTSAWDERDPVELLHTSRIAVYAGDYTSNPAAIWECVAAGLPIVVNDQIKGGKHVVVSGVTGELASPARFRAVMTSVLASRDRYRPHDYFIEHWDTKTQLERYLSFFEARGWRPR